MNNILNSSLWNIVSFLDKHLRQSGNISLLRTRQTNASLTCSVGDMAGHSITFVSFACRNVFVKQSVCASALSTKMSPLGDVVTSRTVSAYHHDAIYIWALGSNIIELKAAKLFCNHELYICFENANDIWLEDCIKSEAGVQNACFSYTKMFVTLLQIQHSRHTQTVVLKPFRRRFFTAVSLS